MDSDKALLNINKGGLALGNDIKIFYDLMAEKTAEEWYKEEILMPSIKDFLSLLPAKPRVLDLGCGTGHESMRLALSGAEVIGIDFSTESIKIARKLCPQCNFELMDFRYLDASLGEFDGVFACGSLIHIAPDDLPVVLENINNVLKDGAYAVMIIQQGTGINEEWSWFEVDGRKLRRTVYAYTKDYFSEITKSMGLFFVREGYLDKSLLDYGWRSYIFRCDHNRKI